MTFKDLYIQLVHEAKQEYPNNYDIQDINIDYLINRQGFNVVDIFTDLDMLQWERETVYKWNDRIDNYLDSNVTDIITKGLQCDLLAIATE